MFRHGFRSAELVALKWSQIDLLESYIDIHRLKHGHDTVHPSLTKITFTKFSNTVPDILN
nr:tyrosine-type recombinase/integrase [Anabaena sphaerica]